MSDEDAGSLRCPPFGFHCIMGGAFIRRVYGHAEVLWGNVFSPKFRRSFRVESCLVFRHFQKEIQERKERFSED